MNVETLQHKLLAAARSAPADERVPFAYEKRIMARLANGAHVDLLGDWSTALWRAAISCVAIVVISGAWSMWSSYGQSDSEFSQEFETAVFASAGSVDDAQ